MSLGSCERDDFATSSKNRKKKVNNFSIIFIFFVEQGKQRAFR